MKFLNSKLVWFTCANLFAVATAMEAKAQSWRAAPAYDKALAANILDRSVFFLPMFGAVYQAKFEVMVKEIPKVCAWAQRFSDELLEEEEDEFPWARNELLLARENNELPSAGGASNLLRERGAL